MNGMSDVRLTLHSQELQAGQERAISPREISRWSLFWHRRHTRKALLHLTREQLRDVGLTSEQARQEGLKPFWRD
ncbi:uncharacterized protein YjiS (DUF1127 family) [Pseudomonas poae]|uniref:Uncharacterized protein YjiS (DUF1127 family) n=1 Tax=Pseudomonas poae TaxID=200451 RepID=A0A7Z1GPK3_9PSED|nr:MULTISPECIES: DUF1127 domain-containing protein [Pseudomonas]HAA40690.1 DUF1127 domain-containing protein [Pseudomonas sp.]NMZ92579.1 DUF1127 domain-containing protein [Pseudomonas marginalis]PFG60707.1 uncharacterized protein YjiS (DUF1127 family) [Pseudomonas poae]PUB47010.1 uncharacterized protein YjiS (DUF1127 family) [Pseudomonas sp. GV047]SCX12919.1 Uncharacterized conserved protein YjiS, DUF1127 family [Pseudomonas sp. NFACC25]